MSAQECAASAVIDAEPVSAAATDLAIATSRLAAIAMSTVTTLADRCRPAPKLRKALAGASGDRRAGVGGGFGSSATGHS